VLLARRPGWIGAMTATAACARRVPAPRERRVTAARAEGDVSDAHREVLGRAGLKLVTDLWRVAVVKAGDFDHHMGAQDRVRW